MVAPPRDISLCELTPEIVRKPTCIKICQFLIKNQGEWFTKHEIARLCIIENEKGLKRALKVLEVNNTIISKLDVRVPYSRKMFSWRTK